MEHKLLYQLVHQGGHHNVYCDGELHIKTKGGFCWDEKETKPAVNNAIALAEFKNNNPFFTCDCHKYAGHST